MKSANRGRVTRLAAAMIALTVVTGAAPAAASVFGDSATAEWRTNFTPKLTIKQTWAEKKVEPAKASAEELAKPVVYKKQAPEPKTVTASGGSSTQSSSASRASNTSKRSSGSELAQAQSILAGLIAKYPILAGTSVSFGDAHGYQAVCYYKSGRIVISPTHTRSLSVILNHEIWHVIDWRDNGRIDWGENVPPS